MRRYGVAVGDWVRIERDETEHPSKGTWPLYRGKVGRVLQTNEGEIGVAFDLRKLVSWFLPHEVTRVEPPRKAPQIMTRAEELARPDGQVKP